MACGQIIPKTDLTQEFIMEIRQLQTFIKVVQFQSFSKAAESLGYSQSAVTIQIKNLEQDLNTHLFDRIGKRVSLTPQGERFLSYAYNIINEMNHAKVALDDSRELTGSLRIGTVESLCFSKLPAVLNKMRELHPKVSIRITSTTPEAALEMMEHNEVDLVYILDDPHYDSNWHKAMEVPEDIVFVCSPEYAITRQVEIRAAQLLKYPFMLTEREASYHRRLSQMLASKNLLLEPFLEISNTEFIIQMLKASGGVSLLPYFTVEKHIREGNLALLDVKDLSITMFRQIFFHKEKWVTSEMEEFIRLAKEG